MLSTIKNYTINIDNQTVIECKPCFSMQFIALMYKNYILFKRQWKTNLFIIIIIPFLLVLIPNFIVYILKYYNDTYFSKESNVYT
ncbi:hypothetical protein BCR36DRAFT_15015 [Piromyces finnis]|uniref:Uncharacterized protein n=1 Tax=Piromyces finnis TaxID=1754191 RepID=A0A1Y1VE92_9FUNG|nr:hypothetical protein BCR36DRAFT_15015 [Piromyces finnis]|eukprot:ORX54166.1 hypothetical protein BCR36DRAFT_15015 [Piromyces finnis]